MSKSKMASTIKQNTEVPLLRSWRKHGNSCRMVSVASTDPTVHQSSCLTMCCTVGSVAFSEDELALVNKTVELPDGRKLQDTGDGTNHYVAAFGVFHQLHCLVRSLHVSRHLQHTLLRWFRNFMKNLTTTDVHLEYNSAIYLEGLVSSSSGYRRNASRHAR